MIAATSDPPMPWIYLIVATGDIYEDIPQAQAAARVFPKGAAANGGRRQRIVEKKIGHAARDLGSRTR